MTKSRVTLIILTALNETRAIMVTAPAWAWLWRFWHEQAFATGVLFH